MRSKGVSEGKSKKGKERNEKTDKKKKNEIIQILSSFISHSPRTDPLDSILEGTDM